MRVAVQTHAGATRNVPSFTDNPRYTTMNIIIWLGIGGIIGWLASLLMGTNSRQGIVLNVVVGIVGAFIGGWLLSGLFEVSGTINQGNFSVPGLLVSLMGAVILLALARLVLGTRLN